MKILIVADEPGWIFHRHANEIKKRLTEHAIDIAFRNYDIPKLSASYDVVYVMDPIPLKHGYPPKEKCIMGLRCEFLYQEHPNGAKGLYEYGFPGRCASIKDKCSVFHVVNRNQMKVFEDIVTDKPLLLAQHGVNESIFNGVHDYGVDGRIRVGVAGRSSSNKGFDIIEKACKMADAEFITAQYGGSQIRLENMPKYYSNLDVYVCMSKSEGLNNGVLEAGAMGLPVISTRSGAAEEIIKDGENGFLVNRDVNMLSDFLLELRDAYLRKEVGEKMRETIHSNWTWEKRIEDFRKMFSL